MLDALDAVQLAELQRGPTTYRVFLLRDALQLDLSMTPSARFRPAGPRFRLVFGEMAPGGAETPSPAATEHLFIPTPPVAEAIFGSGVIYALHTRACIERGVSGRPSNTWAVCDHALLLACLREGLPLRRHALTTTFPPRRSLDMRMPMSPRSISRSPGPHWLPASSLSLARARRRVSRTPPLSPSASPSFAEDRWRTLRRWTSR
jgi:hypothetical protein